MLTIHILSSLSSQSSLSSSISGRRMSNPDPSRNSGGDGINKETPPSAARRGRRRSPNSNLPCPVCGELYSRRDNLRAHQRVHSGEKPFKCNECGARFRWVGVLRTHQATHRRQAGLSTETEEPPAGAERQPVASSSQSQRPSLQRLHSSLTLPPPAMPSSSARREDRPPQRETPLSIRMLLRDDEEDNIEYPTPPTTQPQLSKRHH